MIKKRIWLLLCCLQGVLIASRAQGEGQSNIAYADGQVRFTVIADGAMRLEYAPDGKFTDDRSFVAVKRAYQPVDFRLKAKGDWVEITTSKMKMRYRKGSGAFTENNLSISSAKGMLPFSWKPGTPQKGNLKGTYRTLDGFDGDTQAHGYVRDSKQGTQMPLEDGLLATDGWTLIDDSKGMLFDNDSQWSWVKTRQGGDKQDWYFLAYGHDYKAALKDFTRFAGEIPLPPRYAFGYWWSRYWLYSDKEFRQLVDNFHAYRIPLDVMVVDMDWHYTEQGKGGWTGWTWNRDLFPDPAGFLGYLKSQNLKVTLNLHPADGVAAYEEQYPRVAKDMGIDPATKQTVPWVSSDKRFVSSMFKEVLDPMRKEGVDFWWLDWQQDPNDHKIPELSNTWWLNYAFFSHAQKQGDARPMIFHRWGGLGNHRYQIGFSGDAVSSWKTLDYQPYFNATASNVLYGYWGHDLGGHIGDRIDPEMYVRWLQFGALSPIMRTHSQKNAHMNKEPWVFGKEYAEIIRQTIRLRYELAPYIYTMAREATDTGVSLCRPLYYDYPENEEAYTFRNEYMFGDNILVAPITAPATNGYATRDVWLPEGEWYEWSTGTLLKGGRTVGRSFAIDEYPIYVKAGAVLPLSNDEVMNLSGNDDQVVVALFPGAADGQTSSFNLYEDNGNDKLYASQYATTPITATRQGDSQTIVIGARTGHYRDMPAKRAFQVRVLSALIPQSVTVDGTPAHYSYDGERFALIVDLPATACDRAKMITIHYPTGKTADFDGLPAAARRVAKAMEGLKYRDAGICFKEELGRMGSLSEAVGYAPDRLPDLVNTFWTSFRKLPEVLKNQGLNDENTNWFLQATNWKKNAEIK
ncbi:MAG: glycoside hydrolase family 31 protein [Mediterranea sp.]|jgi:alpha-glucosidase (family GH31 glycosyl hydrolase)|nr:glycoside hydrolase family 31 protein [Mediterranea sp.]